GTFTGGDGGATASPEHGGSGSSVRPAATSAPEITPAPTPTPRPGEGGTELYGYLPYWQMNDSMAAYLPNLPLSTLALFSVSARRTGAINTGDVGYKRITGGLGRRIIADAHARHARVDLVFTSFGPTRNGAFFGRLPRAGAAATVSPVPGSG